MIYEVFMQRMMHRTGVEDRSELHALIEETLLTLGEALSDDYAMLLADQLPPELSWLLLARERGGRKIYPDDLYREVRQSANLPLSVAVEHAQVACQVFAEALDQEGREILAMAFGPPWQPLFEPRPQYVAPAKPDRGDQRTLATGAPGSTHPLSEADVAHRHSVAASEHPHEGDKLSSSHGKPHRRTLAEGKPGSSRPLSDSH
jgi:uncharacterized protein (DUF2267 family)